MLAPGATFTNGKLKVSGGSAKVPDFINQGVGFMNDGSVAIDTDSPTGSRYRAGIRQNASGAFFATATTSGTDIYIGGIRVSTAGALVYENDGTVLGYSNGNPYTATALAVTGATATDPFYAFVTSLLHFDGANLSTTFTDQKGVSWSVEGANAYISNTQSLFGGTSGFFGNDSRILAALAAGFGFGTGDYTLEFAMYPTEITSGYRGIADLRIDTGAGGAPLNVNTATNTFVAREAAVDIITSAAASIVVNTWTTIAISRASGNTRLFLNGNQAGSTFAGSTDLLAAAPCVLGCFGAGVAINNGFKFLGYMDEFRVTKGVGRYVSNYTPATEPFPNI